MTTVGTELADCRGQEWSDRARPLRIKITQVLLTGVFLGEEVSRGIHSMLSKG